MAGHWHGIPAAEEPPGPRHPPIPETREGLMNLAADLRAGHVTPADAAVRLEAYVTDLWRRRRGRRAPNDSRPMSARLTRDIRLYAEANPDLTELAIGHTFGVNQGRVSEALFGFRG